MSNNAPKHFIVKSEEVEKLQRFFLSQNLALLTYADVLEAIKDFGKSLEEVSLDEKEEE